jgi:2-keto-4-pentenoate hydratase
MSFLRTAELAADPRARRGMDAQLALRRERLAAGDEALGWKLGFGAPEAMRRLSIGAPLVGFLMRSGQVHGEDVALGGWTSPHVEPEVAVHVGPELSIAGLGAAFELADIDGPMDDVEAILASNVFQRGVVLGPASERSSLAGVTARVAMRDGGDSTVDDPEAVTGPPLPLLRHVDALLAAFGERLRPGDVVITGALVPPIPVAPGDAIDYELDPLGSLSLRFTR